MISWIQDELLVTFSVTIDCPPLLGFVDAAHALHKHHSTNGLLYTFDEMELYTN